MTQGYDGQRQAEGAMTSESKRGSESAESVQTPAMKPFIRWAGGKSRLFSKIVPYMPPVFENYFEPFLGGGAVFLGVHPRIRGETHLADLNTHLIAAWISMRDHQDELKPLLAYYQEHDSQEFYYEVRSQKPSNLVERAARFFYLNGVSWNHLWRENSKTGAMNVPWGDREFKSFREDQLDDIRNALAGATIEEVDFREVLGRPKSGDFVYLDPPYLPLAKSSNERERTSKFNKYTAKVFDRNDLENLASCCKELTHKGVKWIMSNRDTEEVRDLFSDSIIVGFTTHRSVAAQSRREVEARRSPEAIIIGK